VDGQNASLQRRALAKLDWLVVRDLYKTETATFWIDSPEVKSGETKPEDIATEIFLLPAAATAENVPGNPYAPVGSAEYPCVLSTYRLTEHHLSGSMSRWLPWLSALQPELFVELSPEHAREIGAINLETVQIVSPRAAIRAKALVTPRIRPFLIDGKVVHHVGMPWHWGYNGISKGDVVNDLSALVGDPNVTIHEAKVFVLRVEKLAGAGKSG
jgi:anaerobic selenocysteine-containing dehydrogenase